MKKFLSIALIGVIATGLLLSGCEKKSESEKALDSVKKEADGVKKSLSK